MKILSSIVGLVLIGASATAALLPISMRTTNGEAYMPTIRYTRGSSLVRLEGTNIVAFGDPQRTNGMIYMRDGGLYFPVANPAFADSYECNKQSGGLHWLGSYTGNGFLSPPPNDTPGMGQPDVASIVFHRDWGSSLNAGVVLIRAPNLRLEEGHGGLVTLGAIVSIGNEDYLGSVVINYTPVPTNSSATTNFYGFGHPLEFRVLGTAPNDATRRLASPGIQSHSLPNAPLYNNNQQRMGELWLMSGVPMPTTYDATTTFNQRGNVGLIILTNGTMELGRKLSDLATAYADDTTIDLNFNANRFSRHRLSSNTTFTVSGLFAENEFHTNLVYQRTLILESGATPKTLSWPAALTWANAEGNAVPPASLAGSNLMELTLRGYYDGLTTNVLASAMVGSNKTLVDSDLASFLQRASITDSNMVDALQYLTYSLKRSGLWQNLHVIYPMVGGNSNAHAMNLRSNACNIIYTSSGVTHNANGITGNGSSGYGDTGYKLNYAGASTNAMIAVYSRSQTPTDGGRFFSVIDGTSRMGLMRNGASLGIDGPMNNLAGNAIINTSSDLRGFMALSRTNANDYFAAWRTTVTAQSAAAVGTIGNNLFVLARNSPPAGFHSDVNLAFACAGHGITPTAYTNLMTIVNRYQTILGRNVP